MIFKERQLIRCKQLLCGKIHNENLFILRTPPKPRKEMFVLQEAACHINTSIQYLMYKRGFIFSQECG
jgi:hypothetical protein